MAKSSRRLAHEQTVFVYVLLGALPAVITALSYLWFIHETVTLKTQVTLTVFITIPWLGCALAARTHVMHPFQTMANLLSALREGDFAGIVRVLGHELNNSLAPIKSIAGTLSSLLKSPKRAPDWEEDMASGLDIIAGRAESLARFMQAYAGLARLPQPTLSPTLLRPLIQRVVALETRLGRGAPQPGSHRRL